MHMAECVSGNKKSEFHDWDLLKKQRILGRLRDMTKRHAARSFGIAINKNDYESMVPEAQKRKVGSHFTFTTLCHMNMVGQWRQQSNLTEPINIVMRMIWRGHCLTCKPRVKKKLIDFVYRAEHEMTVEARALIHALYGRDPSYSLWNGCSGGGREGLLQASRYPDEFDGDIAGGSANIRRHAWALGLAVQTFKDPEAYLPPAS